MHVLSSADTGGEAVIASALYAAENERVLSIGVRLERPLSASFVMSQRCCPSIRSEGWAMLVAARTSDTVSLETTQGHLFMVEL